MSAGGKRENAGRKPNETKGLSKPKVTKCFRVDEEPYLKAQDKHGKALNEKINAYIKRLGK